MATFIFNSYQLWSFKDIQKILQAMIDEILKFKLLCLLSNFMFDKNWFPDSQTWVYYGVNITTLR